MNDQPSYRLIAAAVILIAYFTVAGIVMHKIIDAGLETTKWEQVVVIFNAIGALATTAAGVLFGAEVQQANVRNAVRDSQFHAAETERKEQAMLRALDSLEPTGTAANAGGGAAKARAILQQALGRSRSVVK